MVMVKEKGMSLSRSESESLYVSVYDRSLYTDEISPACLVTVSECAASALLWLFQSDSVRYRTQ